MTNNKKKGRPGREKTDRHQESFCLTKATFLTQNLKDCISSRIYEKRTIGLQEPTHLKLTQLK